MKDRKFPRRAVAGLSILALVSAAAFYFSPAASGQQERARLRQDVERVLSSYDELSLNPVAVHEQVQQTGRLTLATSRGTFDLALEPRDLRAPHYRAEAWGDNGTVRVLERTPVRTYKGTVRGMEGAQARFTIDEQTVEGVIITPGGLYFVEPAKRYSTSAANADFIFYAASSVRQESFGECGVTLAEEVGTEAARVKNHNPLATSGGPTTEELFGPALEVDLATEADFEYFQAFGSSATAANNEILSIMNQVEGIFNAQLGLQFNIIFQRVWDTAADPYTTAVAGDALNEFRAFYNSNTPPGAAGRDLIHLWTGKDFDGSTIGIAYRPGFACPLSSFSYGMSQRLTSNPAPQKFILTAHEIGHNFSATHTDTVPASECSTNSIMFPSLGASTTTNFCQFSRDEITNHSVDNTSCLTQLVAPGCTYSIAPAAQQFGSAGGSGGVNVTTGVGCGWAFAEGLPWLTVTAGETGTGSGAASYTVAANTGGPRSGRADIAGQKLTVTQLASANCATTPIIVGQTLNGQLANTDCRSGQPDRPNAFIDLYTFSGLAGQRIRIEMNAAVAPPTGLDTYLYLFGPGGTLLAENDDIVLGSQTNSRIPLNGFFTLPETGVYTIEATSFDNNETGGYTLILSGPANTISFSNSTYTVAEGVQGNGVGTEGTGFVTINVTRTGDTSGAVSVDYATSNGTADSRKDYIQALGTLRFAAGETTKSFTVLITDDRFAEPTETVNLNLSNPVGATLGTAAATLNITSANDPSNGPSPVKDASFNAQFFVRQQYHDFLNREPDVDGLNFWVGQTTGCGNPDPLVCRVNVSAAFFISIEFQETGYLVYRIYKAAYGDISAARPVPVRLDEFLRDTQAARQGVIVGVGNWQQQLENNKNALAAEFVTRTRFTNANASTSTAAEFVDGLFAKAGQTPTMAERQAAINSFGGGGTTGRASALLSVADSQTMRDAEFRKAFVLLQYVGYLRRNPDDPQDTNFDGYNFWLSKLNQFNGNFVQAEMVKAFIESAEYGDRFGL